MLPASQLRSTPIDFYSRRFKQTKLLSSSQFLVILPEYAERMLPTYIPVQKVKAKNGIVYAYRRLGPARGIPLVLHMHVSNPSLGCPVGGFMLCLGASLDGLLGSRLHTPAYGKAPCHHVRPSRGWTEQR